MGGRAPRPEIRACPYSQCMLWQPSLPERYTRASADDLAREIGERRRELGEKLVILGHHYQTDEIIRHADVTGDSLKLSQIAAKVAGERGVKYVVFCGVHFMAETADMLTPESVDVILPDLSAGCSMADMAAYDDTVEAWETIHAELRARGWSGTIVPITYVNSTAAIKAFVGARGGAVRARRATRRKSSAGRASRRGRTGRSCSCPISTSGATPRPRPGSTRERARAVRPPRRFARVRRWAARRASRCSRRT